MTEQTQAVWTRPPRSPKRPDHMPAIDIAGTPIDDLLMIEHLLQPGTPLSEKEWESVKQLVAAMSDWTVEDCGWLSTRDLVSLFQGLKDEKAKEKLEAIPPSKPTPSAPTASASGSRKRRRG